jgi:opacity protein-like surface antigen
MKKILGFLAFTLLSPQLLAEGTEISVFSGYRTGGDLENADTGNKVSLDETNSYGIIIGMDYGPEHVMEFLYSFQQTDIKDGNVPGQTLLNVDVEYFQIGGSQIWTDKKIDKFFGATLGAIHLSPNDSGYSSTSKFAMSVGGGMVYKFTDNIGLRLEMRGYFSSIGSSEALCLNDNCIVVGSGFMKQFDINAGLRIRF